MQIHLIDWIIIIGSLLICFVPALFVGKKSGENTTEFFASGRSVPWWLAGLSMVATTFSSDTPNWVTQQVRQYGVAGNWQWWAFVLTGVATVFYFARLWRRSGVMTDLEFYEVRYSGKAAQIVRGFRAIYLGLFFNCFIMGMVTLAACKIANILFCINPWWTILVCGCLNVVFAAHSGLWGVLVIDMIQFGIKMTAVIAAAWFSLKAVAAHERLGDVEFLKAAAAHLPFGDSAFTGLHELVGKLSHQQVVMSTGAKPQPVMTPIDGTGQPFLNMLPNFRIKDLALMIFIMPVAIGWWANWYPGAEPGGGSYIAQRMLASKSEKDSLGAVLFFNLAHYVLRPWPWIITALSSIIIYPNLAAIQSAFPRSDSTLIGHDSAFPAMLVFLPAGFVGLMVGGLIAANSSTILTHLNWGSSYLVHDFYRRFVNPTASERHYVNMGRLSTLVLYIIAALLSRALTSAQEAFEVLITIGAGTGLIYLMRWFWWRINAWCEVVAMVSSYMISIGLFIWKKTGHTPLPFADTVLFSVGFTTIAWLVTAFIAPATDRKTLMRFYSLVHPSGPGWKKVRAEIVDFVASRSSEKPAIAPATEEGPVRVLDYRGDDRTPPATERLTDADIHLPTSASDHMGMATTGWISGCIVIWSSLFAIGNFLYGRMGPAMILTAVFVVSGLVLLWVINHLWDRQPLKAVEFGSK